MRRARRTAPSCTSTAVGPGARRRRPAPAHPAVGHGRLLEVRADGLWAELVCERRASTGASGSKRSACATTIPRTPRRRTARRRAGPRRPRPRVETPDRVIGELLVGRARIPIDADRHVHPSRRDHSFSSGCRVGGMTRSRGTGSRSRRCTCCGRCRNAVCSVLSKVSRTTPRCGRRTSAPPRRGRGVTGRGDNEHRGGALTCTSPSLSPLAGSGHPGQPATAQLPPHGGSAAWNRSRRPAHWRGRGRHRLGMVDAVDDRRWPPRSTRRSRRCRVGSTGRRAESSGPPQPSTAADRSAFLSVGHALRSYSAGHDRGLERARREHAGGGLAPLRMYDAGIVAPTRRGASMRLSSIGAHVGPHDARYACRAPA